MDALTVTASDRIRSINKEVNILSARIAEHDKALAEIDAMSRDVSTEEEARRLQSARGRTLRHRRKLLEERKRLLTGKKELKGQLQGGES